jgi:hypothetical protein
MILYIYLFWYQDGIRGYLLGTSYHQMYSVKDLYVLPGGETSLYHRTTVPCGADESATSFYTYMFYLYKS